MTLSAMRRALQTGEENSVVAATTSSEQVATSMSKAEIHQQQQQQQQQHHARLPPDSRGVKESRSSIIKVDLSAPETPSRNPRRGTLTFANSVRELRRAGSSRVVDGGDGGAGEGAADSPPCHARTLTLHRTPPRRAQSCKQG